MTRFLKIQKIHFRPVWEDFLEEIWLCHLQLQMVTWVTNRMPKFRKTNDPIPTKRLKGRTDGPAGCTTSSHRTLPATARAPINLN